MISETTILCAVVFYASAFAAAYVLYNWGEWRYRRAKSGLGKVLSLHRALAKKKREDLELEQAIEKMWLSIADFRCPVVTPERSVKKIDFTPDRFVSKIQIGNHGPKS